MPPRLLPALLLLAALPALRAADAPKPDDLAAKLRGLDPAVLATDADKAKQLAQMLGDDVRARRNAANRRSTEAWHAVKNRADWERFRDPRIAALRKSLGEYPAPPKEVPVRTTRTLEGDGYRIENLVFESRPGLWVTANLYMPRKFSGGMPGILIFHSHHNPKTQGELQDMGVLWAKLGCAVLIPDQLGHGERRQHPFVGEKDFPQPFRVGRQDYYFRYNLGLQLGVLGDSLIGWMAWDMMRGLDVLLARPGVDPKRIVLLGAVAGGGDPAAVTAALDPRFKAVAPFNFGGPQPETVYPLPANPEDAFNYAGGGSFESTRNLRLSARDGFLPWVIVGSVAPRGLIYAHEFSWDREHDPVWKRLETIYGFYDAADKLAFTHGRGKLSGRPPEATHCNNIGPEHRKLIYAALKRWFDIPAPAAEPKDRRPAADLTCLTPDLARKIQPKLAVELAGQLADERMAAARKRWEGLPPEDRRARIAREWDALLGGTKSERPAKITVAGKSEAGPAVVERIVLNVERDIRVPALLLLPKDRDRSAKLPVVVGLAQGGKERFLKDRSEAIALLLKQGVAVCLPDVRGTGETKPGDGRGRSSSATALSSSEQMLGGTLVGARLRDLSALLDYLGTRPELDGKRVALWGESFAPVNPPDRNLAVPHDAPKMPDQSEPLGGLLAVFGALDHDRVRAVVARGGLVGFRSLLDSPFLYTPHDAIVPASLTAGDLSDVIGVLAPRPVRLEGLVDGLNRRVGEGAAAKHLKPARSAYEAAKAAGKLEVATEPSGDRGLAGWLVERLK